jgi:hypothetical protein
MLTKLSKILKSRTILTLVFMVIADVISVYGNLLTTEQLLLVNTILAGVAGYFRVNYQVKKF